MNKTITLLFGLGTLCPILIFGQGKTSIRYFGNSTDILFNDDAGVAPTTDLGLKALNGYATICKCFGNLLFYNYGIRVYDHKPSLGEDGRKFKGLFALEGLTV